MRTQLNMLWLLSIFFIGCTGSKGRGQIDVVPSEHVKEEKIIDFEVYQDFRESADLFAKKILGENLRKHSFDALRLNNPKHIEIFIAEGLDEIIAYSNKNYPQKFLPSSYKHFLLFVATYTDKAAAKSVFERISDDAQFERSDYDGLESEIKKRVKALNVESKPGGLITQSGRQVFSLVENCKAPPLFNEWHAYESMFVKFITDKQGHIQVLKAACGESRYYSGLRISSLQH